MIEKFLHSALWLFVLLLVYLTLRASGHNRETEPPAPPADTLVRTVQYFGAMTGGELVDTAANRIGGNVEALYALFDRLYKLETWYDTWGRPGPEPFPGGEPLPDSLLHNPPEIPGGESSEEETPAEETIQEENAQEASALDNPSEAIREEESIPDHTPKNPAEGPSAAHTPGETQTVDVTDGPGYRAEQIAPDLADATDGGIYPRPASETGPEQTYPFDPLREVVSILQLGDSHVQGGFYPRQLRTRLQYRFGNAGRGLLTPYRLMKTNQPQGYEISSPNSWTGTRCTELHPLQEVGATGAAIATPEKTIELTIATPGDPFQRITVFHHAQAPLLSAGDNACEIGCPWEDTPTMTRIPLRDPADRVVLRGDLRDSVYNVPVFHGFMLENGHSGLLYHSVGINGNTFTALARQPQIIREAAQLAPDLIILSLGTNDSYGRYFDARQIAAQLDRVIELCRRYAPHSQLLLTTPMECFSRVRSGGRIRHRLNPNAVRVRDAIVEVAHGQSLPYWDFYAASGGAGAMDRWNKGGLTRADKVHLTPEGYLLQGEMLYQALVQAYERYKRSLTAPAPPSDPNR